MGAARKGEEWGWAVRVLPHLDQKLLLAGGLPQKPMRCIARSSSISMLTCIDRGGSNAHKGSLRGGQQTTLSSFPQRSHNEGPACG